MTPKRLAELKQAVTDFPHIGPTSAEAREMVEEIGRLKGILDALVSDAPDSNYDVETVEWRRRVVENVANVRSEDVHCRRCGVVVSALKGTP